MALTSILTNTNARIPTSVDLLNKLGIPITKLLTRIDAVTEGYINNEVLTSMRNRIQTREMARTMIA